ncbi:ArdC-like ssDNA-binding domain-containing protein [Peribacillus asahii]|uniref:ArdC-like ssDNA-binding domain-containing protein n=1 Tax=Peribacillus asahii TaxID=228899 RepID=UPI002079956C|nr:ArdC-like ssDNA-binding domain-containing protein [Peribacillus asahii]USK72654.1 ArdC family protein [Peribacillus asahii]USK72691.1 ArdC family protein [Peribacillus asahii]
MAVGKITADNATMFERFSETNYEILKTELECECEPYQDIFTFNRWKAQGFFVKKGEKAYRIPTIIVSEKENKKGEMEKKSFKKTSCVFCRCQVEHASERGEKVEK